MMRIAIVEDEQSCIQQLTGYLERYAREHGHEVAISVFADGDGITQHYKAEHDIILMDIEMPLVDGFSAAQMIRQQDMGVVIVFITNMAQHAVKGYAVDALDYIIKPIDYLPFSKYMDRAVERVQKRAARYMAIPIRGGMQKLEICGISYIESQDHSLIYHTGQGEFRSSGKMHETEERLKPYGFLRCHIGYLVNLAHVEGFRDGQIRMRGERLLPVSRSQKKAFFEALISHINEV